MSTYDLLAFVEKIHSAQQRLMISLDSLLKCPLQILTKKDRYTAHTARAVDEARLDGEDENQASLWCLLGREQLTVQQRVVALAVLQEGADGAGVNHKRKV